MEESVDWQNTCPDIKSRGQHILETEKWSDCRFLVGTEPNQQIVSGHKLILAMASPVFERMFYGNLPADKNDPILIPDVQPDAFRAMMEYIYSDKINISSFDKACELCYVAKKYILPHVVEECTQYLWSDLNPKNACRAYEFAKLFEEPRLMHRCIQIILTKTREVLADPSFLDIELSTLLLIFDQSHLNIETELDLFNALSVYAHEKGYLSRKCIKKMHSEEQNQDSPMDGGDISSPMDEKSIENFSIHNAHNPAGEGTSKQSECENLSNEESNEILNENEILIKNAVKKIRFLTLTPSQFAEGPARSNLLTQSEALSILINISSPTIDNCPLPEGFCLNRELRNAPFRCLDLNVNNSNIAPVSDLMYTKNRQNKIKTQYHYDDYLVRNPSDYNGALTSRHQNHHQNDYVNETLEMTKLYCVRTIRQQMDYRNTSITDCALKFHVNTNILITGVQVPTQVLCGELMTAAGFTERYSEVLYAHLLDAQGSRLTYTHCTSRVRYDSLLEISFDRPVQILRNRFYKIGVVFNKIGWYPIYTCSSEVICENVRFVFDMRSPNDSLRDGLIRAIVFTHPNSHPNTPNSYSMIEEK